MPVHVLVVHAVVVLVPLAVLGAVLIALWPAARRRHGWLVVAVAAVGTASIPIATSSGEGLERHLPRTALLSAHTHLGDQLLPFAALLLVAVAGLMLLDRHTTRPSLIDGDRQQAAAPSGPGTMAAPARTPTWIRPAAAALSVITVLLAVVTAVQVVRIGDSGARAAWGGMQYVQQAPPHRPGAGD
nr:DUF2231 domain-containing protein [Pseudonocardia acidicola]